MTTQMINNEVIIENAILADIPAMVALLSDLFGIEQDFHADSAKQVKGLQMLIESGNGIIKVACLADELNGKQVIGMVTAQLVVSTAEGAKSAWVEDMVVAQAYRAQGIGRQLLQAVLSWSKTQGATRAQLLVDMDNESAIGYYSHLGWQVSKMNMRRIFLTDGSTTKL
jgi:ribosomal protein S18 acetylase RimI-like enzyme